MDRACSMHEKRNVFSIFVEKPERKRPLGRPRRRRDDNTKIYLRDRLVCYGVG
jgi:hypothetical protein